MQTGGPGVGGALCFPGPGDGRVSRGLLTEQTSVKGVFLGLRLTQPEAGEKASKCMGKRGHGPKVYGCDADIIVGHCEPQAFARSKFDQRGHGVEGAPGKHVVLGLECWLVLSAPPRQTYECGCRKEENFQTLLGVMEF